MGGKKQFLIVHCELSLSILSQNLFVKQSGIGTGYSKIPFLLLLIFIVSIIPGTIYSRTILSGGLFGKIFYLNILYSLLLFTVQVTARKVNNFRVIVPHSWPFHLFHSSNPRVLFPCNASTVRIRTHLYASSISGSSVSHIKHAIINIQRSDPAKYQAVKRDKRHLHR